MTDSISSPVKVDGRRLRSDRSRQLIVESMLQLIKEGNLVPTAQQVADHAKVGIRSVFRHFEDMEAIFATADELWRNDFVKSTSGVDPTLPLEQRIIDLVNGLVQVYESNTNILKSTAIRRWRSAFLKQNYAKYQSIIRSDVQRALPELGKLPQPRQEAIFGTLSFEYWDRLRDHQKSSAKSSKEILIQMLETLVIPV
jgi:AcrR family transcriptional regulator